MPLFSSDYSNSRKKEDQVMIARNTILFNVKVKTKIFKQLLFHYSQITRVMLNLLSLSHPFFIKTNVFYC